MAPLSFRLGWKASVWAGRRWLTARDYDGSQLQQQQQQQQHQQQKRSPPSFANIALP